MSASRIPADEAAPEAAGSATASVRRWDLFCRVVDNFGDIGIAWRLARQLAHDPQRVVRLFVDDVAAFGRIEPRVDAGATRQRVEAVDCIAWRDDPVESQAPGDVVVEMFGAGLPAATIGAMTAAVHAGRAAPVWIDYEYLSAERWVGDFHGRPSPRPDGPLVKHYFYPGFDASTGGLLFEPGLQQLRRRFVGDAAAVDALWRCVGVPPPTADERRLSLFAYDGAPVAALLRALARDARPWSVVVPTAGAGSSTRSTIRGATSVAVWNVPFVAQGDYDRLLWACDVNFVRGEDSFLRAQAAGRPFVWQIYRQPDRVHLQKLAAFEDRYDAGLPPDVAAAQRHFWACWNGAGPDPAKEPGDDVTEAAASAWFARLPALSEGARRWRDGLAAAPPLVERLATFVAALAGSPPP